MADAQASGACGRKIVWVQVPSPALFFFLLLRIQEPFILLATATQNFVKTGSDPVAFFCCAIFLCSTEFFFAFILLKKAFSYDTILKI